MKRMRMFGIAMIAASALMTLAGVGGASAATLTCPTGTACPAGAGINAESEGKTVLDAPFGNVECQLRMEGHTTTSAEGGASGNADGPITGLTWTNCGNDTVNTLATGSFSIASSGTFTSTGARITIIHVGIHCIFETANTPIGVMTGTSTTGGHATLDLSGNLPRVGGTGGAFCGSSAPLTGSLAVIAPVGLDID